MACYTVCRDRIADKDPRRVRRPEIQTPTWAANPYHPELTRLTPTFRDDGVWILAQVLPHRLAAAVAACRPLTGTFLVPVSSRPVVIRRRGIDYTWVLVRRVIRELGIEAARLLRRRDGGDAQRTQGHAERQRLPGARFLVRVCRSSVILIGDVVTTGTSLAVSCETLTRSGTAVTAAAVIGDINLVGKW